MQLALVLGIGTHCPRCCVAVGVDVGVGAGAGVGVGVGTGAGIGGGRGGWERPKQGQTQLSGVSNSA